MGKALKIKYLIDMIDFHVAERSTDRQVYDGRRVLRRKDRDAARARFVAKEKPRTKDVDNEFLTTDLILEMSAREIKCACAEQGNRGQS